MTCLACSPLIEADIPAVLDLDQRCLGGLWTRSGYQRELDSEYSDLLVLISSPTADALRLRRQAPGDEQTETKDADTRDKDELQLIGVGCLWAILEEAHITTLAIEPTHQGQKLGQLLLTELLLHGYRRGLERATLEVRESNLRALHLYQKFNFKEAGIRKRYYSDGENARILWHSPLQSEKTREHLVHCQQRAIDHLQATYKNVFIH